MQACQPPELHQQITRALQDNQAKEAPAGEKHGVAEEEADSSVTEETEVIPQQAAIPFPMEEREGRKSRIIPPSEALAGAVGLPIQEAEAGAIPVEPVVPMANLTPQEAGAVHTTLAWTRQTPQEPMTDTGV